MRFLIVGVGSIGQRHLKNLRLLGHEVLALDANPSRLADFSTTSGVEVIPSLEVGMEQKVDGVLVCTPPASHVPLARSAVGAGMHVFIEKPLAPATDGVAELVADAAERGVHLLAGANLRFFRSLRRVKAMLEEGRVGRLLSVRAQCGFYLPFWRPAADYKGIYSARREQGGGILLDAIHEFDYLRWLGGEVSEIFCVAGRWSRLAIDVEDLAEVTLRFASGVLAQLHLDYLQRSYRRNCELIGEDGVIVWDYIRQEVTLYGPDRDHWEAFREPIDANHNEMFIEEMRHFVRCIEGRETPVLGGQEALRTLRLVEAAKASSARRCWITI